MKKIMAIGLFLIGCGSGETDPVQKYCETAASKVEECSSSSMGDIEYGQFMAECTDNGQSGAFGETGEEVLQLEKLIRTSSCRDLAAILASAGY